MKLLEHPAVVDKRRQLERAQDSGEIVDFGRIYMRDGDLYYSFQPAEPIDFVIINRVEFIL